MANAEQKLWRRLRREQLGVRFRRQHPFDSYVLDFVCLEKKLVVEVDGSQHAEPTVDAVRTANLEAAGFRVLRSWNNEVLIQIEAVLERILAELTHPLPGPPLEREGAARDS
jgi:very-short-patch-repair endonuclease